ncbi:uncharacterized protein LOC143835330 isoform X3 [Paroedura picta]|uniref:uncharacterized protein LOC143835330 isoform X3 n=1 Tax=Paroedura picta TaxID=143630 RepID=UPI004056F35F
MPPFLLCAKLLQLGLMKYMDIWEKRTLMRPGSPMIFDVQMEHNSRQRRSLPGSTTPHQRERDPVFQRCLSQFMAADVPLRKQGFTTSALQVYFPKPDRRGGRRHCSHNTEDK